MAEVRASDWPVTRTPLLHAEPGCVVALIGLSDHPIQRRGNLRRAQITACHVAKIYMVACCVRGTRASISRRVDIRKYSIRPGGVVDICISCPGHHAAMWRSQASAPLLHNFNGLTT